MSDVVRLDGRFSLDEALDRYGDVRAGVDDETGAPVVGHRAFVESDDGEADVAAAHAVARAAADASSAFPRAHALVGAPSTAWFLEERIAGASVAALAKAGPTSIPIALRIIVDVADALCAAGVVHGRLRPARVVVQADGRLRVTGLYTAALVRAGDDRARRRGATTTRTAGRVKSGLRWLAPEVVRGAGDDARTDVYGLGLLAWTLVAGAPPFPGGSDLDAFGAILRGAPRASTAIALPAAVDDALARATALAPDDRFTDSCALAAAFALLGPAPRDDVAARAGR